MDNGDDDDDNGGDDGGGDGEQRRWRRDKIAICWFSSCSVDVCYDCLSVLH